MGHMSGRCRIWNGALTRLIGEKTAPNTGQNDRADAAADGCLRPEGIMQDERKHPRDLLDMEDDDSNCNKEINPCHQWDEQRCKACDAVNAAEDDHAREHGKDTAHHIGVSTECLFHRERNGICLHGNVNQSKRHGDQHGEKFCDIGLPECILYVVCRAAMKKSMSTGNLIDLCECALDKSRRRADEGDDPHPKDSTGTARHNGNGDTRNIADPHARRCAHAERLKRGNRLAPARAAPKIPRKEEHHLRQCTQLDKAGHQRKPKSTANEYDDDDVCPEKIIDRTDGAVQQIHRIILSALILMERQNVCQIASVYSFAQLPLK